MVFVALLLGSNNPTGNKARRGHKKGKPFFYYINWALSGCTEQSQTHPLPPLLGKCPNFWPQTFCCPTKLGWEGAPVSCLTLCVAFGVDPGGVVAPGPGKVTHPEFEPHENDATQVCCYCCAPMLCYVATIRGKKD